MGNGRSRRDGSKDSWCKGRYGAGGHLWRENSQIKGDKKKKRWQEHQLLRALKTQGGLDALDLEAREEGSSDTLNNLCCTNKTKDKG